MTTDRRSNRSQSLRKRDDRWFNRWLNRWLNRPIFLVYLRPKIVGEFKHGGDRGRDKNFGCSSPIGQCEPHDSLSVCHSLCFCFLLISVILGCF